MSEQTDQIKADVEALQAATTKATDYINTLEGSTVTDDQFNNLHNALVSVTDQLNAAVPSQ